MSTSVKTVLSLSEFFDTLSDEELELVAGICEPATFDEGHILITEDDTTDEFYVIASGRVGENTGTSVATNAMFTCLHTDSTVQLPASGQVTTQQFFWFLDGSLDDLLRRASRDLKLQIPAEGSG